jgi:hypothetical protein
MAHSSVLFIAISLGVAGCARGPAQPSSQSSEAIASLQEGPLSAPARVGETAPGPRAPEGALTELADAPRHAQDAQNAALGEYVLPASEPASVPAPQVQSPDPDFAKFKHVSRSLEGEADVGGPIDQGTGALDRQMTERIRKAVRADPLLSYNAKAISIVTKDGHVTLKGVVNNSKERAALEQIASHAVGADKMSSELKVK